MRFESPDCSREPAAGLFHRSLGAKMDGRGLALDRYKLMNKMYKPAKKIRTPLIFLVRLCWWGSCQQDPW